MKKKTISIILIIIAVICIFIFLFGLIVFFAIKLAISKIPQEEEVVIPDCVIQGTIAVSTKEENTAAMTAINNLFNALESSDEQAIKGLFSEYAINHSRNLDQKIKDLIEFYPGAEGGYDGASVSDESNNYGVKTHSLDLLIDVENQTTPFRLIVSLYMRDDTDPSKIGVHLIEVYIRDDVPNSFKHKGADDPPGIYVLDY